MTLAKLIPYTNMMKREKIQSVVRNLVSMYQNSEFPQSI